MILLIPLIIIIVAALIYWNGLNDDPMSKQKVGEDLKKFALSIAVIAMMNLFFNTGLAVFNPSHDYNEFCPNEMYNDAAVCEEYGGNWIEKEEDAGYGYCDERIDCWELQRDANEPVERINFIVLVSLGVLALVLGAAVAMPSALAHGLMYGGVLSILIGWGRAAMYLDNIAHFIISGIFLVILFTLGWKKMRD
jgi:hypothetical protein